MSKQRGKVHPPARAGRLPTPPTPRATGPTPSQLSAARRIEFAQAELDALNEEQQQAPEQQQAEE